MASVSPVGNRGVAIQCTVSLLICSKIQHIKFASTYKLNHKIQEIWQHSCVLFNDSTFYLDKKQPVLGQGKWVVPLHLRTFFLLQNH